MRATVDYDRCESHGLCEVAAPQIYRLDDDGKLHLTIDEAMPVPTDLESTTAAGARACPVAALRITEA